MFENSIQGRLPWERLVVWLYSLTRRGCPEDPGRSHYQQYGHNRLNSIIVGRYFVCLKEIIEDHSIPDQCLWNGLSFGHQPTKVCARTGTRNVLGRVSNSKECVTAMARVGGFGQPYHQCSSIKEKHADLYKVSTQWMLWATLFDCPNQCLDGRHHTTTWFEDVFLKNICDTRPQLLLWDSHLSHETLQFFEKAKANDMIVMSFPPHTTHYLCPLDRTLFAPLKTKWNTVCSSHMRDATENTLNKGSFGRLFNDAYSQSFTLANVVYGFELTSIVAWNPLALLVDAFAPRVPHSTTKEQAPEDAQPVQSDTHPFC